MHKIIIRRWTFDHVPATSPYNTTWHYTTFYLYFLFFKQVRMNKTKHEMYKKYIKNLSAKYEVSDKIMKEIVGNATLPTSVFRNVIISWTISWYII